MADLVTLIDAKQHLRIPPTNSNEDYALQGFIYAAEDVIRAECGDVMPKHYDESYDGGNTVIYLRHRPILSVENVEEGWGWYNYELDYQQVNTQPAGSIFAFSIDAPEAGAISRRSAGNVVIPFVPGVKNIRVLYTAGRSQIPGSVRLACLELIAHWFQSSQLRATANNSGATAYDAVEGERFSRGADFAGLNYGVPFRVLELLKPYRRLPIIG
jgi:hypothetical protein